VVAAGPVARGTATEDRRRPRASLVIPRSARKLTFSSRGPATNGVHHQNRLAPCTLSQTTFATMQPVVCSRAYVLIPHVTTKVYGRRLHVTSCDRTTRALINDV
jgi:hypothetical protein